MVTAMVLAGAALGIASLLNAHPAQASGAFGIQEFPLPAGCSLATNIFTPGLNGMPVFSQNDCSSIGVINSAGQITEYPLPTHGPTSCGDGVSYDSGCPGFFAIGSDGNLWTPTRGPSNAGP